MEEPHAEESPNEGDDEAFLRKEPTEVELDVDNSHVFQQNEIIDFSEEGNIPVLVGQVIFDAFTRGCKWSPDGLCILTETDDDVLSIYDLPPSRISEQLVPAVTVREAETVYDYNWYPLMDSNNPDLCLFATTSQFQPIHLHDAYDGHLRATYRCINHLDEMVSAQSICFDPSGEKLYAGLKNEIRIFDVNLPGKECDQYKFSKRKKGPSDGGFTGIVSSINFNPSSPTMLAAATYSSDISVFIKPLNSECVYKKQQKGGITHVQFTPDGTKLIAGGRKDKEILVWDMRNIGSLYGVLHREVTNNQRIFFDITGDSRYLVTGGTNGQVRVFDLLSGCSPESGDPIIEPLIVFDDLHKDCVNGVSLHPHKKLLATSSGQRYVSPPPLLDEDDDEEIKTDPIKTIDFSLKIWSFDATK